MNIEQVETQLRGAGQPLNPSGRLRRAVLQIPTGGHQSGWNSWRTRMAIAVAAVILLGVGAGAWQQLATFHPVATIALHGSSATANAEVGPAHGPNRPVRLIVQHLSPGHQNYFELWSLDEHPPMMLTTFMTDSSGSCTLMFSMPASMPWNRLAVTTLSDDSRYLLSSTG